MKSDPLTPRDHADVMYQVVTRGRSVDGAQLDPVAAECVREGTFNFYWSKLCAVGDARQRAADAALVTWEYLHATRTASMAAAFMIVEGP